MTTRRSFIGNILAASVAPALSLPRKTDLRIVVPDDKRIWVPVSELEPFTCLVLMHGGGHSDSDTNQFVLRGDISGFGLNGRFCARSDT